MYAARPRKPCSRWGWQQAREGDIPKESSCGERRQIWGVYGKSCVSKGEKRPDRGAAPRIPTEPQDTDPWGGAGV